jgi:hypothetical protein
VLILILCSPAFTQAENAKKSSKNKPKEQDSMPAEEQNSEQQAGESAPITKKPRVTVGGRRSPTPPENKDDTDSEAEEAEDIPASDDEAVVSDEEPEDEVEELEDEDLDRELNERDTAEEEDDALDGNISD